MSVRMISDEVFLVGEGIVRVTKEEVLRLQQAARRAPRRRSRLCAHKNTEEPLHEMLIVHERSIYVRPHKHLGKSESFHVICGEFDVVIFGEDGLILDVVKMGDYASGNVFYYRLSDPLFHTVLIRSDVAVFHETTNGPFRSEDTVFADWSPDARDEKAVLSFLGKISVAVESFARRRDRPQSQCGDRISSASATNPRVAERK